MIFLPLYCVHYGDVEVSVVVFVCLSVSLSVFISAVFCLRDE